MLTLLSVFLFLIFLCLGSIHFYWAKGGRWGSRYALPTDPNGKAMLKPSKMSTVIVGMGLTSFGIFYLIFSGILPIPLPHWLLTYSSWIIPIIFLLRAIGEFKYVGFFKKVKGTAFAIMDRKLFSPLCLAIGGMGLLIAFLNYTKLG